MHELRHLGINVVLTGGETADVGDLVRTVIVDSTVVCRMKKKDVIEKTKAEFLKMSGEIRGIPRYPKVGKLPDYDFSIKVSLISMKVLGQDRRIVGRESIQTEAGMFDCFVLEDLLKSNIKKRLI